MIPRRERYRGCLAGLAAGDAVGAAVEFEPPGTFPLLSDMIGGGPHRLQPGEWTDDTSMALCLAESLTECGGFDPGDQMERYVRWWRRGHLRSTGTCFDIGDTTRAALARYETTGEAFAGAADPCSAGNGSLMRLAPTPLFFAAHAERAIRLSGESSRTTHGAETCIDACRYFGGLIVGAANGAAKAELLSPHYAPVAEIWEEAPLCAAVGEIASGSFLRREPPEIVGSGYVVKSLEAALWAFAKARNFEEGCLLAANLGDDADTTAAIYGQIAGAHWGLGGIPERWRRRLAHAPLILGLADGLLRGAEA